MDSYAIDYSVELDGRSAIVRRTQTETRRRWFRTRTEQTVMVVGVFPCHMAFELERHLNRTPELVLELDGRELRLKGREWTN